MQAVVVWTGLVGQDRSQALECRVALDALWWCGVLGWTSWAERVGGTEGVEVTKRAGQPRN